MKHLINLTKYPFKKTKERLKVIKNSQKGFTLVEVLVSIVISVLLLATVLGSFWNLMSVNQKNETFRVLQKQANFAMIRFSDKIKSYRIDYARHLDPMEPKCQSLALEQQKLCLLDRSEGPLVFEYDSTTKKFMLDGQTLFSDYFLVKAVSFRVSPHQDPFKSENLSEKKFQLQPKVTLSLLVESKKFPEISLNLQTTVSTRKYK